MDRAFVNALLATPPRVLGRQLLPLTLRHAGLLDVLQCPFLTGKPAGLSDLAVGVYVCSLPGAKALEQVRLGKVNPSELRAWVKRQGGALNHRAEAAAFREYVETYFTGPELFSSSKRSSGESPAGVWGMVQALMHLQHMTMEEAWETPVCAALCLLAHASEMVGGGEIVRDDEQDVEATLDRMNAALVAEAQKVTNG